MTVGIVNRDVGVVSTVRLASSDRQSLHICSNLFTSGGEKPTVATLDGMRLIIDSIASWSSVRL
jgi:hypothetical protein